MSRSALARPRRGFSLVELLVVIAIVAVLVGLVAPALARAYRRSQTQVCLAHLHQLFGLVSLYATDNDGLVVYSIGPNNSNTWADILRPYLGLSAFVIGQRPVSIFACPSSTTLVSKASKSDYGKNVHISKNPEAVTQFRFSNLGTPGKLFALGDATARDLTYTLPLGNLAPRHDGRANVVYFDGHAESLDPSTVLLNNKPPWLPQ